MSSLSFRKEGNLCDFSDYYFVFFIAPNGVERMKKTENFEKLLAAFSFNEKNNKEGN